MPSEELQRENTFNFYFRMYVNDARLKNASNVNKQELQWEMDLAWRRMLELIPETHIQAIDDLLNL